MDASVIEREEQTKACIQLNSVAAASLFKEGKIPLIGPDFVTKEELR